MGLPFGRTNRLVVGIALLLCLSGCLAPEKRPISHEPEKPIARLTYGTHFTSRGTEVEVPDYFAQREELLLLALQEIDNLGIHRELPGWIIHVVRPTDPEKVDRALVTIHVRWRTRDHEPIDQTLPNLAQLVDTAAFP